MIELFRLSRHSSWSHRCSYAFSRSNAPSSFTSNTHASTLLYLAVDIGVDVEGEGEGHGLVDEEEEAGAEAEAEAEEEEVPDPSTVCR